VADHARDRTYHNSALLLPDMRVLLGGHSPIGAHYGGPNRDQGRPFANNDKDSSFEVWSPPYLFRGARPTISRAPAGVAYGETFTVGSPQATQIESVLLVRTPSPQHINDPDQRSLSLDFQRSGNALSVTAPPNGIAAPPGYYYLVVNKKTDQGPVPSVARIVHVGTESNPAEAIQPYPDDNPAAPSGGSATPDADTSNAAAAQQSASQVAKSAPAPVAGPATAATDTAAAAYRQLSAQPAGTSRPLPAPFPALPAVAIGITGTALIAGRRFVRRAAALR
jgi:hypothetical protein